MPGIFDNDRSGVLTCRHDRASRITGHYLTRGGAGGSDPPAGGRHHLRPLRAGLAPGRGQPDGAAYGASRHFVRQALFQLERQGIVLREKNIGATVRFYSAEEVRQITRSGRC